MWLFAVAKLNQTTSDEQATNVAAVALSLMGMFPGAVLSRPSADEEKPEESSWESDLLMVLSFAVIPALIPALLILGLNIALRW